MHSCNHHVEAWKTSTDLILVPDLLSFQVFKGSTCKHENLHYKEVPVPACQGLSRSCVQPLGVHLSDTHLWLEMSDRESF